jgi:hypothetical protein
MLFGPSEKTGNAPPPSKKLIFGRMARFRSNTEISPFEFCGRQAELRKRKNKRNAERRAVCADGMQVRISLISNPAGSLTRCSDSRFPLHPPRPLLFPFRVSSLAFLIFAISESERFFSTSEIDALAFHPIITN